MLTERRLKTTRQREVILEELRKSELHPTADEMYEMVKRRLPKISLGTVYRNLEVLSDCGVINKLEIGGAQMRFDCKPEAHYHLICTGCGMIEDFPADSVADVRKALANAKMRDFQVTAPRIELFGLCRKCRGRKTPHALRAIKGSR